MLSFNTTSGVIGNGTIPGSVVSGGQPQPTLVGTAPEASSTFGQSYTNSAGTLKQLDGSSLGMIVAGGMALVSWLRY